MKYPPSTITKKSRILITGAAGLVGQNLMLLMREQGYENLVAVDKHRENLAMLAKLNPGVETHCIDLAREGEWQQSLLTGVDCVIQLQAQITGLFEQDFINNNQVSTSLLLKSCEQAGVRHLVHISSSVLHSKADDFYVQSKTAQEKMVLSSSIPHVVLRPTLMFGWFDPKHFGWLSRFMEKVPLFPIPGSGKYVRQPLYNRDFCRVILFWVAHQPDGHIYDIVGAEDVTYIDIIRRIRQVKNLKTPIVCIPYSLFYLLLKVYALFSKNPPFTASQLKALTVGDYFRGVDIEQEFGVRPTPFAEALAETFTDPRYSSVVIER